MGPIDSEFESPYHLSDRSVKLLTKLGYTWLVVENTPLEKGRSFVGASTSCIEAAQEKMPSGKLSHHEAVVEVRSNSSLDPFRFQFSEELPPETWIGTGSHLREVRIPNGWLKVSVFISPPDVPLVPGFPAALWILASPFIREYFRSGPRKETQLLLELGGFIGVLDCETNKVVGEYVILRSVGFSNSPPELLYSSDTLLFIRSTDISCKDQMMTDLLLESGLRTGHVLEVEGWETPYGGSPEYGSYTFVGRKDFESWIMNQM